MTDVPAMQRVVQREWTPGSHWHIGDLAWQTPSMDARPVALWPAGGDEVLGWAWVEDGDHLEWHAPASLLGDVLKWFDEVTDGAGGTVGAMESDAGLLEEHGCRVVEAPFFRHCLRDLTNGLPPPEVPAGYVIRPVRDGEDAERAAVHRAAWRPETLGRLQVPPVTLSGESGMTAGRYRRIMNAWPYRHALDLVVEAPDGTFVASALGWYDEVNRSALLEPVGTDARHARRGLGAAVSLACLHAMREAGATLAVVCPRGDDAYPVPRTLYHRLGFRDAGRTVTLRR